MPFTEKTWKDRVYRVVWQERGEKSYIKKVKKLSKGKIGILEVGTIFLDRELVGKDVEILILVDKNPWRGASPSVNTTNHLAMSNTNPSPSPSNSHMTEKAI